jgi:hypothetical protein
MHPRGSTEIDLDFGGKKFKIERSTEIDSSIWREEFKIEIDSSIWREEIQNNRNRLLDLAGKCGGSSWTARP